MNWYQTVALAFKTLSRNRLRSFLMMLGVAMGIASLIAMASVGEATRQETMRRFKRMIGTFDIVNIQPGSARTRGMPSLATVDPSLKFADAQAIAREAGTVKQVAEVQFAFDIDVKHRERAGAPAVFGVSANWMEMRGFNVTTGSILSEDDVRSLARVAVIGEDVRATLFPSDDPIGKTLRIGEVPFRVTGVLESRGVGPGGASMDNMLLIPVTTASKRLFNRDYLTSIAVQLKDPTQPEIAITEITAILRERHGIVPTGTDDFQISNPQAAMSQVTQVDSTLSKVLVGVAIVATLIGGIVIMSLMLISVSERRREIGMRRAVGANRRDVMIQFLIEAAVVSAVGGLIGIGIGIAGATIATLRQGLPPVIIWDAIATAVLISISVGLIFGLHPAWRAANVDPIEALRS